jgi:hypothetical protein
MMQYPTQSRCLLGVAGLLLGVMMVAGWASAGSDIEFPGTVISADPATGKVSVKKEAGGTRFTFVTNEATKWEHGLKGIGDLKKDDPVVVFYKTQGSQYVAVRIAPKK